MRELVRRTCSAVAVASAVLTAVLVTAGPAGAVVPVNCAVTPDHPNCMVGCGSSWPTCGGWCIFGSCGKFAHDPPKGQPDPANPGSYGYCDCS